MVVTSVAFAGTCLGSRLGTAFTVVAIKESKLMPSIVTLRLSSNILSRNRMRMSMRIRMRGSEWKI